MINLLIALSIGLFSFEMFSLTTKISSLNKTMVNLPISTFIYSIPLTNENNFYFEKVTLEDRLNKYFESSIQGIVNDYQTSYSYYSSKTDSFCMSNECDIINISLKANIDSLYTFERTMRFSIGEGNNG